MAIRRYPTNVLTDGATLCHRVSSAPRGGTLNTRSFRAGQKRTRAHGTTVQIVAYPRPCADNDAKPCLSHQHRHSPPVARNVRLWREPAAGPPAEGSNQKGASQPTKIEFKLEGGGEQSLAPTQTTLSTVPSASRVPTLIICHCESATGGRGNLVEALTTTTNCPRKADGIAIRPWRTRNDKVGTHEFRRQERSQRPPLANAPMGEIGHSRRNTPLRLRAFAFFPKPLSHKPAHPAHPCKIALSQHRIGAAHA